MSTIHGKAQATADALREAWEDARTPDDRGVRCDIIPPDHVPERYPPNTGPEWDTVEQERDYWKALALSYAAKIGAMDATMKRTWTVKIGADGNHWIEEDNQ